MGMNTYIYRLILILSVLGSSSFASALNICAMTFNSDDEKKAIESVYGNDPAHKIIELVPQGQNGEWLKNACASQVKCDVLVMSGHFGGLFFGEKTLPTLSMTEMFQHSCQNDCPNIFESVKSIYLMGCNTLATKKQDHRSIEDYLSVLVGDGFPLQNAEVVAASRYANFGESIENQMRMIFPKAELIFGFDSTGPLGKKAGPLLKKALQMTPEAERNRIGASATALMTNFKGLNARVSKPDAQSSQNRALRCELTNERPSDPVIEKAFAPGKIRGNFDVALQMKDRAGLDAYISRNFKAAEEFKKIAQEVLKQTRSMIGLQKKVYDLMTDMGLMSPQENTALIEKTFVDVLREPLDYIRTEQLCDLAESSPQIQAKSSFNLPNPSLRSFHGVLAHCFKNPRGDSFQKMSFEAGFITGACLQKNKHFWQDWDCLTANAGVLDLNSCLVAAQRNPDPSNADNMRWFCWDRLREQGRINQSQCLALSKSMNILGNRIKSNWNCLNDIKY